MAQLIIANGGTMRAAQLSELMQDMYGTGQRYVRLILANDHRFHTISFGLWGLTDQGRSDFENG